MPAEPKTMQGWRSPAPGIGNLEWAELPCPAPAANEALVRVEAAALNFSDLLMIDDIYQIRPPRPFVPGQEIAGTVVVAGASSGLAAGERIASKVLWGGFAEYAIVRGDMAMPVPDAMPLACAVALPVVYMTALAALTETIRLKEGETALVLAAAGGVGLAAVEIARYLGAHVIAAAGGRDKLALARAHGADEGIDYREPGWSEKVKALTEQRGADVIFDPVGGPVTKEALRALAWEGRLLVVGFSSGEISQIPANRLLLKRASAIGVYWDHDRDAEMLGRLSAKLAELAAKGVIRPHTGARFPAAELPLALEALASRKVTGKAVIEFTNVEASR